MLDHINISSGKALLKSEQELILGYIQSVELLNTPLQMGKVKRNLVTHILLKIIPVTPLDTNWVTDTLNTGFAIRPYLWEYCPKPLTPDKVFVAS